jgi:hypothetical protein
MRSASELLKPHVSIPLHLDGGVRHSEGGESFVCVRISLRAVLTWAIAFNFFASPLTAFMRDTLFG